MANYGVTPVLDASRIIYTLGLCVPRLLVFHPPQRISEAVFNEHWMFTEVTNYGVTLIRHPRAREDPAGCLRANKEE